MSFAEIMVSLNDFFWLIALISVTLALFQYAMWVKDDRALKHRMPKATLKRASFASEGLTLSNRTYNIILAAVVLLGIAIRIWKFGIIPYGANQDGAMAAVDAKALADYATDRFGTFMPAHLYAWGYGQMSSLLSYIMSLFIKLFGLNIVVMRLPNLLVSLMGGAFFYLFVRDIFGKGAGLIAAIFVAINPWHLLQSRWALDANLFPHFFMGGLYFLNKGLCKKTRYTYLSMVFFALCMYCYGISIYSIPLFLWATCIYYLVRKRLKVKDAIISAVIYLAIAWPFILTMMVNYFQWDTISLPFVTIQHFEKSVRANDILFFSKEPWVQLQSNVQKLLNMTLFQEKDASWNAITGFGTMYLFTMPFVFVGLVELFRHKTQGAKGLVILALLTGAWIGIATNGVNVNRVNLIYYSIMMLAVLGLSFTMKEIKYLRWTNLCIYAVAAVMLVGTYFTTYNINFYPGFGDALVTAEESGAEQIYVTSFTSGRTSVGVSEILTLFYDKMDAKYFQGESNEEHGKTLLPYKERFIYVQFNPEVVNDSLDHDAAYVIRQSEWESFDEDKFEMIPCGEYYAAVIQKK